MINKNLLSIFFNEFYEEKEQFLKSILSLEKNPYDKELVEEIYINIHTIKGSCSSIHNNLKKEQHPLTRIFESLTTVCHTTEDFLEKIKTAPTLDASVFNLLLKIENFFENNFKMLVGYSGNEALPILDFSSEEKNILHLIKHFSFDSTPKTLHLRLTLNCEEDLKHPYLSIVYREINEMFPVLQSSPTKEQLLEVDDFDDITILIETTVSTEETIEQLKSIHDIETIHVIPNSVENNFPIPDSLEEEPVTSSNSSPTNNFYIKLEPKRIDKVLKHSSQLVILKNKLDEFLEVNNFLANTPNRKELEEIIDELKARVDAIQDSVLEIRMTPLEQLYNRFPIDVREIANEFHKPIKFTAIGGRTEIDKNILDQLYEPFIHIIRNSIIHGIEDPEERIQLGKSPEGLIHISATSEKNKVLIKISDDGRGIDTEKIKQLALNKGIYTVEELQQMSEKDITNIIFKQGFSLSKKVNKYSGRGVGMEAFRRKIEQLQGYFEIQTEKNKGTTFLVYLPLTTSIIDVIITKIHNEFFSFPLTQIEEVTRIKKDKVYTNNKTPYIFWRNVEIPLVYTHKRLNLNNPQPSSFDYYNIIILHAHNQQIAVTFDDFIAQQSVVVKNIHNFLPTSTGINNYHVIRDGSISLIVDTNELIS